MKIASLVDDLTLSQSSFYMIKNFNKLAMENKISPYCFYHNLSGNPTTPLFSIMQAYHAVFFHSGKIIATNLSTLRTLVNIDTNSEKYFYIWDLEWLREKYDFMENVSLINRKEITLIARSESHAKAIRNYCNKEVNLIIEDWNYKQLEKLWTQKTSEK